MTADREVAEIVLRNQDWFIAMAGLDAGRTDHSLRNDLLRLVELAKKWQCPVCPDDCMKWNGCSHECHKQGRS